MKNIIYNLKEKRYVGRKQINNHLIVVHAKTQLECYQRLKQRIKDYANNNIDLKNNQSINFKSFIDAWYKNDKEPFISEATKKDFKSILKTFTPFYSSSLKDLDKQMILNFINSLPNNRTKEKSILYLKAILKSALANKLIKSNPFDTIITPPRNKKKKEALTYEEQVNLLSYLSDKKIKIPILIYLITGMRKNEFDFKNIDKQIDIETKTLKALNLKGRNNVVRYKRIRLTDNAIKLIMNNIDIINSYDAETCYREFADIMKNLNIKKSIVNLRHTFATNHLYLGTPEFIISKEMGHSTSQITKDNYMDIDYHLNKEKISKLYNNLYPTFE